ncbi:hypothetical protein EP073_02280 [Geovibrio thiophilus]|uniref:phosphoglycolate phosphatase n=1 Tax=Geovibrio thiophilus TaxID=139438 RepID=A0A410JVQ7_9BACT|nr:HAD hydrolase-like protein [Geovibrio thiophilus]QAR32264.1 hypothetical protein EP073_02280 [Geovibrio thiophilus]
MYKINKELHDYIYRAIGAKYYYNRQVGDNFKFMKITDTHFLFFDLDGTLVDTDYANFLSYSEAIKQVLGINVDYNPNVRFTREIVKKIIPNITDKTYEKVVKQKNSFYKKNLSMTKINDSIVKILKQYSETNKTVLITNCHAERAIITLDYHGLSNFFYHKIFRQEPLGNISKYKNALDLLRIPAKCVFAFENDKTEIEAAVAVGIPRCQILCVGVSNE